MKRSGWLVATIIGLWAVSSAVSGMTALSSLTHCLEEAKSNKCDLIEGKALYLALNKLFRATNMVTGLESKSMLVKRVSLFVSEAELSAYELISNLSPAQEQKLFAELKAEKEYAGCKRLVHMVRLDLQQAIATLRKCLVAQDANKTKEQFKSWCRQGATRPASEGYAKAYFLTKLLQLNAKQSPMEVALQKGFVSARAEVEDYISASLIGHERKNKAVLMDLRAARAQRSLHYLRRSLKRSFQDSWVD
mgnify:CR=1 FL=1